jgi:hypothetical protein
MPELNLLQTTIEVNGKKFKLQHPGNREWIKLKGTLFKVSNDQVSMEALLDYFFEFCVFPEQGPKLTLDTVNLIELEEVWGLVAPKFFSGSLATNYRYPDKQSKR